MDTSAMPPSLKEHVDAIWKALELAGWAAGSLLLIVCSFIVKMVFTIKNIQSKVVQVIGPDALEHGYRVVLEKDCANNRAECEHVIIADEIKESMKVVRAAIHLLILYSKEIPDSVKQNIVSELEQGK